MEQADELAALRRDNAALCEQVKGLVKAEGWLYRYQEQLDAQVREYQELYQFNRKLNATLELPDIFALAADFIINNLGYERVLFFGLDAENDRYAVRALDGYYHAGDAAAVGALAIARTDPLLSPLYAGDACLIFHPGRKAQESEHLAALMKVSEYLLYPLGSHASPVSLLAIGNSSERAPFCRRVSDSDTALLGIGNLAGLLSSTIENQILFANTRKALEQERLAEAKYRGIFENAVEGIFQTTPQGRFLSCNPATAEILGYDSPGDILSSVSDVGNQLYVDQQRRKALLEEIVAGRPVKSFEVEFYRKDGKKTWVRLSIRPNIDAAGNLLHLDGIMEDISDRKQAEEAIRNLNEDLEQRVVDRTRDLESANAELKQLSQELDCAYTDLKQTHSHMLQQEKMASIGQLAAGVAHEINNPMGFIISNLGTLGKYAGKLTSFLGLQEEAIERLSLQSGSAEVARELEERKAGLKIPYIIEDLDQLTVECLDGAERVKKIVQDLKDFSRSDEGKFVWSDLHHGIDSTLNIVANEIKYKADVIKEYGSIPQVECILSQLNQVFMNLLVNAAHAMSAERRGKIFVLSGTGDGETVWIEIADDGCGIPPANMKKIFDPFFTTKPIGQGTGLGLSLSYGIVQKHHGRIQVSSEAGKGTSFRITLPVRQPSG